MSRIAAYLPGMTAIAESPLMLSLICKSSSARSYINGSSHLSEVFDTIVSSLNNTDYFSKSVSNYQSSNSNYTYYNAKSPYGSTSSSSADNCVAIARSYYRYSSSSTGYINAIAGGLSITVKSTDSSNTAIDHGLAIGGLSLYYCYCYYDLYIPK